ncbi:MAG: sulfotransferase [Desulfatiglandales bacterium]
MSPKKRFPDFVGIGATRGGSSWLHYVLAAHPDIWVTPVKELHYYDRPMNGTFTFIKDPVRRNIRIKSYIKNMYDNTNQDGLLNTLAWDFKFFFNKRSEDWYKSLFAQAGNRIAGEVTPAYAILSRDAIARMAEGNPGLKAVYMLRDPIERAWSSIVNGLAKKHKRSISDVSEEAILAKIKNTGFQARSNYAENIRRWRDVVGEERFFIGFFEDIKNQPHELIERLCDFLGVRGVNLIPDERLSKPRNSSRKFSAPMPPKVAFHLAKSLYPMIRDVQGLLGGNANQWLEDAENILNGNYKITGDTITTSY